MYIQTNAAPITIVHEAVHALDRQNNWHLTPWWDDEDAAEALAYGMEHLLGNASNLQTVEKATTTVLALKSWTGAWSAFNNIAGTSVWVGSNSRNLTVADLWDVNQKLGLRFSCAALVGPYNAFLVKKGLLPCLTCTFANFNLLPPFL